MNDPRGLAPEGWHVPTDFELRTLIECLGGLSVAGGPMKETGTTHWLSRPPNADATNTSGFTALPGGTRHGNGPFFGMGSNGYWWSSTQSEFNLYLAHYRNLHYFSGSVFDGGHGSTKGSGFSVRCLRD